MSGHSKWSSIKHKKGALDAKRGKLFSKIIREPLALQIVSVIFCTLGKRWGFELGSLVQAQEERAGDARQRSGVGAGGRYAA